MITLFLIVYNHYYHILTYIEPIIETPKKAISKDRERVAVGGIFDGPSQQYRYYSPERVSKYNTNYRDTKYIICGEKQKPPPPVKPDQIFGPPIEEPKHKNRSLGSGKETKFVYDMLHGCDQPPTYKARVNRTSDSSQVLNTLSGTYELPVSPIKASRDHGNIIAWA